MWGFCSIYCLGIHIARSFILFKLANLGRASSSDDSPVFDPLSILHMLEHSLWCYRTINLNRTNIRFIAWTLNYWFLISKTNCVPYRGMCDVALCEWNLLLKIHAPAARKISARLERFIYIFFMYIWFYSLS